VAGQAYSGTIATNASDPNGDTLTFAKVSGPSWLSVAGSGTLSGTPASGDVGTNSFVVSAADPGGLFNNATVNIAVTAPLPLVVTFTPQGAQLRLSWSGGAGPYQAQVATNLAGPVWQNVGPNANYFGITINPTNAAAFYRIQGH
jgi:hypothetical protein